MKKLLVLFTAALFVLTGCGKELFDRNYRIKDVGIMEDNQGTAGSTTPVGKDCPPTRGTDYEESDAFTGGCSPDDGSDERSFTSSYNRLIVEGE